MLITAGADDDRIRSVLAHGDAVVLPTPSPFPYVVAGTDPVAVNTAKGRPAEQHVGLTVRGIEVLAGDLRLTGDAERMARWLADNEALSVLLPTIEGPDWLRPSTRDGYTLLATVWLPELDFARGSAGYLYMSSANPTAHSPATTAAEAERFFGERTLVADGDHLRDAARAHGSTTIVQVDADGTLTLRRHGINDAAFGDADAYLDDLRRRFAAA